MREECCWWEEYINGVVRQAGGSFTVMRDGHEVQGAMLEPTVTVPSLKPPPEPPLLLAG